MDQVTDCGPSVTNTIVARATASGRAGVGIIRLSGSQALPIARQLSRLPAHSVLTPRKAMLCAWYSGDDRRIDTGLTLYFPAPHSFTGETVIELHAHGGMVVLDWLLERCVELGARLAYPGEFSERAFLSGKLDLAQAEAVADLIDAASREAVVGAGRSLQGVFSDAITTIVDQVTTMRTHIEAAIDFVDEDLETDDIAVLSYHLGVCLDSLGALLASTQTGVRLQEGASIAIAGRPNAGKSSVLNALARTNAAIVSPIPGTTRDLVKERLVLQGVPVEVIDTAGLRVASDPIEQQGVARAEQAVQGADLILWVFDAQALSPAEVEADIVRYTQTPGGTPVLRVANKMDLVTPKQRLVLEPFLTACEPLGVSCSAAYDQNLLPLIQSILVLLGVQSGLEGQFMARRRHLEALNRARTHLVSAQRLIGVQPLELVAEELRLTQETLGQITGEFTTDDLLGKIFSTFCVGK